MVINAAEPSCIKSIEKCLLKICLLDLKLWFNSWWELPWTFWPKFSLWVSNPCYFRQHTWLAALILLLITSAFTRQLLPEMSLDSDTCMLPSPCLQWKWVYIPCRLWARYTLIPLSNLTTILQKAGIFSLILWLRKVSLREAESCMPSPTVVEWQSQDKNPGLFGSKTITCPTTPISLLSPKGPSAFNHYSEVVRPTAHFPNPIGFWPGFCLILTTE